MVNLSFMNRGDISNSNTFHFPGVFGESIYTLLIANQNRPLHLNMQQCIVYSSILSSAVYVHKKIYGNLCFEELRMKENLMRVLNKWKRDVTDQGDSFQIDATSWKNSKYEIKHNLRMDSIVNECFSAQKIAKRYEISGDKYSSSEECTCKVTWRRECKVLKLEAIGEPGLFPKKIPISESFTSMRHNTHYNHSNKHTNKEIYSNSLSKLSNISSYIIDRVRQSLTSTFGLSLRHVGICLRLSTEFEWEFRYFDCIIASKPKIPIVMLRPVFNKTCLWKRDSVKSKHSNIVEEVKRMKDTMRGILDQSHRKLVRKMNESLPIIVKKVKRNNSMWNERHRKSNGFVESFVEMELNRTVDLLESYLSHV
jgi:hypothetical protein